MTSFTAIKLVFYKTRSIPSVDTKLTKTFFIKNQYELNKNGLIFY